MYIFFTRNFIASSISFFFSLSFKRLNVTSCIYLLSFKWTVCIHYLISFFIVWKRSLCFLVVFVIKSSSDAEY